MRGIGGWLIAIGIFVFGASMLAQSLNRQAEQKPWECRPQPGYCDIDLDYRPPVKLNEK